MGGRGSSSMGSGGFRSTGDPVKDLEKLGFNVQPGFGRLDADYQKQVTEQLARLESEFGLLRQYRASVSAGHIGGAVAHVETRYSSPADGQKLAFNTNNNADVLDYKARQWSDSGWWSAYDKDRFTGAQLATTHEYGHMLQHVIMQNSGAFTPTKHKNASATYKREILKIAKDRYGLPKGKLIAGPDTISRYGSKNHFEFFAEAFANSQCGKPNAIGMAMRDWLSQKKAQGLL